jgi:hypothetical protein
MASDEPMPFRTRKNETVSGKIFVKLSYESSPSHFV